MGLSGLTNLTKRNARKFPVSLTGGGRGETATQRKRRLEKARQKYKEKQANETPAARNNRLSKRRKQNEALPEEVRSQRRERNNLSQSQVRDRETEEQYAARLDQDRESHRSLRENATAEQHSARVEQVREFMTLHRQNATQEQYIARIVQDRESHRARRAQYSTSVEAFKIAINVYCDKVCDVCNKLCYPNQITRCTPSNAALSYLPDVLVEKGVLEVCFRCKTHITSGKSVHPSKAYWNSLDPGEIPEEISDLTLFEKRLLCRIKAFVRVVRLRGRFGQLGFKGQAILFAQDIFEVTEALPNMLPISTQESGMVVVTEHLENIDCTREFTISRERIFRALHWLIDNNPLYQDVTIDTNARIEQSDMIRVQEPSRREAQEPRGQYKPCNSVSRILHASHHQGNITLYPETGGRQCCAMAFANIVRASIVPPRQWNKMIFDENMFSGDDIYQRVVNTWNELPNEEQVDQNGYISVRHLAVIKDDFEMYEKSFEFDCANDSPWFGNLRDTLNSPEPSVEEALEESPVRMLTLKRSLEKLFETYSAGIFIAMGKCFAVLLHDGKYYFTDSHACGAKGATCKKDENGHACVIECHTFVELVRVCKRATSSTKNEQYTLDYVDVRVKDTDDTGVEEEQTESGNDIQQFATTPISAQVDAIPIQTSMMAAIDTAQPDLEDHVEVSDNLNEIRRKTHNNIVNIRHEPKHEEFAWFDLFPYGKNGLEEDSRAVPITPLDYFQARILSSDSRFQSSSYLFYALSMKELNNVKSMISTCAKKVRNQEGAIEDVHLIMRNVRGSSAYWRSALTDLIAQIRCLGPPTYFITLSCNDLNWNDMRIALLKADGREDVDPSNLTINETQLLVEKYPVIISRHFMIRLNAFMKFIKNTDGILGGKVKDFWWRIEFQNRGSPHAHMLFWIEDHPDLETPEGVEVLERVVSCQMPEEGSDLYELVKKCQVHHHTDTCNKNDPNVVCRFGFPRRESNVTKIIGTTSDEFVRNNGRTCVLKRTRQERWVNNYNPTILELWEGNMDIQPCGTNEAVAYYVAKYLGKAEPENMDPGFAQAIREIRREETDISRKLFKICMKILNERQISACEAVYRLCHLHMRGSSRKTVFLNTRMLDQRYHVLQYGHDDQGMGFCSNMMERYEQRPLEPQHGYEFENMSLLEFAMLFEPFYPKRQNDSEENVDQDAYDDDNEDTGRRKIRLQNNARMTIRTTPAVVKVPYFIAANDPQNFYFSLLMQYKPYRHEAELLEGFDTAREAFLASEDELMEMSERMRTYRERDRQLEIAFNQAHAFQILQEAEPYNIEEEEELEMPELVMNNDEFTTAQQAMNIGQRELFNKITQSIFDQMAGSEHRERLFITGGAGTGKTFLFNVLKNQVSRCYGDAHGLSSVKVAALTGAAARLVGGATLHSLLKLPIQKTGEIMNMGQLSGIYLTNMRKIWKDVKFLFIDEISLVSYKVLTMIDARLKELKSNTGLFGGLNVLVFGDLLQLPPVNGNPIFKQDRNVSPAIHLWHIFGLVELTQNMRQQGDTTFADLLNALRVGEMRPEHFQTLMRKVSTDDVGEFAIDKALRIRPTNDMVDKHNARVIELYKERNVQMSTIVAQDQLVDNTRTVTGEQLARMVPTDIRFTGGLPRELVLFVGAKVMLRSNIDVAKGLVNGNIGHVTEIVWPLFRRAQVYTNDIPSVKIDFGKDGIHLIEPKSLQFQAKHKSDGLIERRMLPLILSWASTVHKMQGCTVDYAKVYLGPKLFAKGQAYVSLSRVRSLDGLEIDELDCSKLMGRGCCNTEALEEMVRMRNYQPPPM